MQRPLPRSPLHLSLFQFSLRKCLLSLPFLTSLSCPALGGAHRDRVQASHFPGSLGILFSVAFNTRPSQHSSPLALSPSAFLSVSTLLEALGLFSLAVFLFLLCLSICVPSGTLCRFYCPGLLDLLKMRCRVITQCLYPDPLYRHHQVVSTNIPFPERHFSPSTMKEGMAACLPFSFPAETRNIGTIPILLIPSVKSQEAST